MKTLEILPDVEAESLRGLQDKATVLKQYKVPSHNYIVLAEVVLSGASLFASGLRRFRHVSSRLPGLSRTYMGVNCLHSACKIS